MYSDDLTRLKHMLHAIDDILSNTRGRTIDDLEIDRMLLLFIVKSLEIVGEAASRVSPETQAMMPEIEWQEIIGMRNRLVHAYYDINKGIVWATVTDDLPGMQKTLGTYIEKRSSRKRLTRS